MDHNGFISSSSLYHQHILNDCHDGRRRGAQTLRGPAGHLELSDLVVLARLQKRNSGWHTVHTYSHIVALSCHKIFTTIQLASYCHDLVSPFAILECVGEDKRFCVLMFTSQLRRPVSYEFQVIMKPPTSPCKQYIEGLKTSLKKSRC